MIWMRADANKEIGTGHVMRCLSVAAALKSLGEEVCFLVADRSAVSLLEGRDQEYIVLESDFRNMEAELPKLKEVFQGNEQHFCLVDSYFVTEEYIRQIRQRMPVGYVDDKGQVPFEVDLLINYNIFADVSDYPKTFAKMILGMQYAPLREEFRNVDYAVREEARRVLITTGGSDKYNLAGKILEKAIGTPEVAALKYCVISGVYNPHYSMLKQLEESHSNVEVLSNVRDMSRLMQESDIAVTAGGSTMYELSAVGVPIICFSFVDNQEQIVEGFLEKGLVCFGGNYLLQGEDMLGEVVEKIALLAENEKLRLQFSRKQRNLVDGLGALRIAGEIVKCMEK